MPDDSAHRPRVLSDEEIEMYLKGDRREVDRLILFSLNRLAHAQEVQLSSLQSHQNREDSFLQEVDALGGVDSIIKRAQFVDALIEHSKKRNAMMDKVSQSTVQWAIFLFLAFLATAVWERAVHVVKSALASIK